MTMCGPSRASMFTGVYPHISSHFWQYNWKNNEVLKNTKTIMESLKKMTITSLEGKVIASKRKKYLD